MTLSRRSFCHLFGVAAGLKLANHLPHYGKPPGGDVSQRVIHLDRNENAYGPPAKVISAIQKFASEANRYVSSERDSLTEALARLHGVDQKQVLLGAGSTDVLRMAAQAFLSSQQPLVVAEPTYNGMEYYAGFTAAHVIRVPLTRELTHDLAAMRKRLNDSPGLVYLCNPSNPTGTITPKQQIEAFLNGLPAKTTVLIDEAYHEYATNASNAYASFVHETRRNESLVVVRTFSKAYALAGLRLGYAIGSEAALERMQRFSIQDCINRSVARAGLAALDSQDAVEDSVKRTDDDRQEFFNQATERMLKPIDSHANFVFMNVLRPAETVIDHYRRHGILLGPQFPSMPNHARISLGTPEEMHEFWRVWDLLPVIESM
ncbi:MAG TPA: histidinol-phosphate transaminase [Terriglobales bacterium]|nr:histidinol-phosphate transaminase [Terriglobales bacterium]